MTSVWDDDERAREWPIESLSAWAAAVIAEVERSGGDGDATYASMYELADVLGMWEADPARAPGQVWSEADLREVRRRFRHLLEPMRARSTLIPEHPVWITLQLVDLLQTDVGLPTLSAREVARRTRYLALNGTVERLIRTQFDLDIAACEDDDDAVPDSRRPETADEGVAELLNAEVRPRTLTEIADDQREEAARADLPEHAVDALAEAAALSAQGDAEAASAVIDQVVEVLYAEMGILGDFRAPMID